MRRLDFISRADVFQGKLNLTSNHIPFTRNKRYLRKLKLDCRKPHWREVDYSSADLLYGKNKRVVNNAIGAQK